METNGSHISFIPSKGKYIFDLCLLLMLVVFFTETTIRALEPVLPPVEICENGIDDDDDGLIDLNDPDCECPLVEPLSLIPNPSFENMECCPSDHSQLHCAEGWIQASTPTTDFVHTCDWLGWDDFPAPLPFPDGEGAMGFRDGRYIAGVPEPAWKEYAGACLLNPLLAGTKYRFEFWVGFMDFVRSPPVDITFFGSPDCDNLPFGGGETFFGCPTNGPGWVKLGAVNVSGVDWMQFSIEVTPEEDIYAIVIGPPCLNSLAGTSTFYFFDNMILADEESFEFIISGIGHPCAEDYTLKVPENPNYAYQWYKDGIALIGENIFVLSTLYGEGDYQVRIIGNNECSVTRSFSYKKPQISKNIKVALCDGESYAFGTSQLTISGNYLDTFKNINNCDSIVFLDLEVVTSLTDSLVVSIFEGENFSIGNRAFFEEGTYTVNLTSANGCDSLVHLILDFYSIFIPNVFSPNGDGVNDFLNVFGDGQLIEVQNLKIFNRWGALMYQGHNISPNSSSGWDGTFKGHNLESGSYVYLATLLMDDGKSRQFSGSVTLVR